MAPFFETAKSYADVEITEKGVKTQDFIEASDALLRLFGLVDSSVFAFVRADLKNYLNGIRQRYESHRDESQTLEALVRSENMQKDPNAELHICFKRSYDETLVHHHSFILRSLVPVVMRAVPRRREFYAYIAQGGSTAKLDAALVKWLEALEILVKHLCDFLEGGQYGRVI